MWSLFPRYLGRILFGIFLSIKNVTNPFGSPFPALWRNLFIKKTRFPARQSFPNSSPRPVSICFNADLQELAIVSSGWRWQFNSFKPFPHFSLCFKICIVNSHSVRHGIGYVTNNRRTTELIFLLVVVSIYVHKIIYQWTHMITIVFRCASGKFINSYYFACRFWSEMDAIQMSLLLGCRIES